MKLCRMLRNGGLNVVHDTVARNSTDNIMAQSVLPKGLVLIAKLYWYLSIQPNSQDSVGVTVVTYFCSFLEVANFQLSRRREADNSN